MPWQLQKAAADELAHFAGKVAGREIPVVSMSEHAGAAARGLSFFIGETAASQALGEQLSPWKLEEWMLRTVAGKGIALAGHDAEGNPWSASTPAGSMLAVYTLLDDYLGVRWFWPGEFGEHVPQRPDAIIPHLNLRENTRL